MKIAITGSTGLVGSRVIELLKNDFEFIPLLSKDLDLTNSVAVNKYLADLNFDLLLHLAAYTNVDQAEIEKDLAYKLNVLSTANLLEITKQKNKKFIYVSTDFVFDGKTPPFTEESVPNPLGAYGQTKYEGEKIVAKNAMIVRLSYPYKKWLTGKKDFVNRIIELLKNRQTLKMVTDSLFTPTFIDDFAYGLKYLITNYQPEIFHLVGKNSLSPYEAGKQIAKNFGFDESLIQPTTFAEFFKNKAARPKNGTIISLKNNFQQMLSFDKGLLSIV